ncbi:hypothetical protein JCM19239_1897 [Vibrio variabilis]|uniref:Uncharacterized protein n=1 Tax=Vibrio variabilis TaxID=990271 RepID=A0ABQ0J6P8_9VIBR|nr:hypothetical protein JCM19239_1897 [Vibrio variabilis]
MAKVNCSLKLRDSVTVKVALRLGEETCTGKSSNEIGISNAVTGRST